MGFCIVGREAAHEPDFVEVAVEEPAMRPLTEPRIEITLVGGHRIESVVCRLTKSYNFC